MDLDTKLMTISINIVIYIFVGLYIVRCSWVTKERLSRAEERNHSAGTKIRTSYGDGYMHACTRHETALLQF